MDLSTALNSARRAYNKPYPKLQLLFDSKGFIEIFFVVHSSSAKAEQHVLDDSLADTDTPAKDLSAVG